MTGELLRAIGENWVREFLLSKTNPNLLARLFFVCSLCAIAFCYGFVANRYQLFPHSLIEQAYTFVKEIYTNFNQAQRGIFDNNLYHETNSTRKIPVYERNKTEGGLSMISSIIEDRILSVSVINMGGELIHRWEIDWFEIWPDPSHIPEDDDVLPKSRPGTQVHGVVLLENGDIIFNFDFLGLTRIDVCGNVKWRLGYRTHHSIYKDEYNNLWVPGQIKHTEPLSSLPNYKPNFNEPTVLKVSLEGEILEEISIIELLQENDLQGLLYMSNLASKSTEASGDTLHLNDVETFPSYLDEGVFKSGDIMVSLRNIHGILIFRQSDRKVTHLSIGEFTRQHDPDFIDGNTISVFDNNHVAPEGYGYQSSIRIKSFLDNNQSYTYFTGNEEQPFYTRVMGKHEWLPNGNLLITESEKGRVFELDQQGNIVWEFINIVADGYAGRVQGAFRLPNTFSEELFYQWAQKCESPYPK